MSKEGEAVSNYARLALPYNLTMIGTEETLHPISRQSMFAQFIGKENLNLGCALNPEPGFINLDMDPRVKPDVRHNLEYTPLPFDDNTFDCILGSHVFEHIVNLIALVYDLGRILKPGGFLISITPYLSSDDATDSPHHVRVFSESTWAYFSKRLYEYEGAHSGRGAYQGGQYRDWGIVETNFAPYPEFIDDPEIEFKRKHWRNVIQELHVVLQRMS